MRLYGVARPIQGGKTGDHEGRPDDWYALARPERVRKLLVGAAPLFPGTSVPGMLRMVASPIETLMGKLMKPSPKLVVRNMKAFAEGETITRYPELIDAQVVAGGDKTYADTSTAELKTIISVWGFRSEYSSAMPTWRRSKPRPRSSGEPTIHSVAPTWPSRSQGRSPIPG